MAGERKLLTLEQCKSLKDRSDMFTLFDEGVNYVGGVEKDQLTFDLPVFGVHGINNPVNLVWFGYQSFAVFISCSGVILFLLMILFFLPKYLIHDSSSHLTSTYLPPKNSVNLRKKCLCL